jgi:hypothetical protein
VQAAEQHFSESINWNRVSFSALACCFATQRRWSIIIIITVRERTTRASWGGSTPRIIPDPARRQPTLWRLP